jgi:hypothetical protein
MSQASRFIGRFRMNDGRVTSRVGDVAEKMELARFPGHQVVAERDGEDLVIYQIGDPDGLGVNVTGGATGDRAPRNLAELQQVFDKAYERRDNFKQQVDRHSASEALADLNRR